METDLGTAIFNMLDVMFISMSVNRIFKDKQVKGIAPASVWFFAAWSVWSREFRLHSSLWSRVLSPWLCSISSLV